MTASRASNSAPSSGCSAKYSNSVPPCEKVMAGRPVSTARPSCGMVGRAHADGPASLAAAVPSGVSVQPRGELPQIPSPTIARSSRCSERSCTPVSGRQIGARGRPVEQQREDTAVRRDVQHLRHDRALPHRLRLHDRRRERRRVVCDRDGHGGHLRIGCADAMARDRTTHPTKPLQNGRCVPGRGDPGRQFRARAHAELAVHPGQVRLDRADLDDEPGGDLLVAMPRTRRVSPPAAPRPSARRVSHGARSPVAARLALGAPTAWRRARRTPRPPAGASQRAARRCPSLTLHGSEREQRPRPFEWERRWRIRRNRLRE